VQIAALEPNDVVAIEQAAHALVAGFREHWLTAWPDLQRPETRCWTHSNQERSVGLPAILMAASSAGSGGARPTRESGNCTPWSSIPLLKVTGLGALVADLEVQVRERGGLTLLLDSDDEDNMMTLSSAALYPDVWTHVQHIRNLQPVRVLPEMRLCAGVIPDRKDVASPIILMAKRVADH
jgi:hypothetical protein